MTRNPYNYRQVNKIDLSPDVIDFIVFWTKNPKKMIKNLDYLNDYNFYFQFTVTPYGSNFEKKLPNNKYILETFKKLSEKIGKEKVIWRYDPIILTDKINQGFHFEEFEIIAEELNNHTTRCVISFLDMYEKTKKKLSNFKIKQIKEENMRNIAKGLKKIALKYKLELETCAEKIDLTDQGIRKGKCIDLELIEKIIDNKIDAKKDPNQRKECLCVESIDIGAYNTCKHSCLYCYANYNDKTIKTNTKKHKPDSPFLLGELEPEKDNINVKDMESLIVNEQLGLFD